MAEQQTAVWKLHTVSALVDAWGVVGEAKTEDVAWPVEIVAEREELDACWQGIWSAVLAVVEAKGASQSVREVAYWAASKLLSSPILQSLSPQSLMPRLLGDVEATSAAMGGNVAPSSPQVTCRPEQDNSTSNGAASTPAILCLQSWQGIWLTNKLFEQTAGHATYQQAQRNIAAFHLLLQRLLDGRLPAGSDSTGAIKLQASCRLALQLLGVAAHSKHGQQPAAPSGSMFHSFWPPTPFPMPPGAASSPVALSGRECSDGLGPSGKDAAFGCFSYSATEQQAQRKLELLRNGKLYITRSKAEW
jgi:hypothetical protein